MLSKNSSDQVRGMVVLPEWPSAPWWPTFLALREKCVISDSAIYLTEAGELRHYPTWRKVFAILDGLRLLSSHFVPGQNHFYRLYRVSLCIIVFVLTFFM